MDHGERGVREAPLGRLRGVWRRLGGGSSRMGGSKGRLGGIQGPVGLRGRPAGAGEGLEANSVEKRMLY